MQTEKSQNPPPLEETELSADEQQDNSLNWLLDQELSETSDSLFSVSEEESGDIIESWFDGISLEISNSCTPKLVPGLDAPSSGKALRKARV